MNSPKLHRAAPDGYYDTQTTQIQHTKVPYDQTGFIPGVEG